ncbi:MAG: protocatechuate 4,5-dioxygenase subunit alpha [Rhodospirillales bacterium]|nr:protocatechuate 4,5-dioxygenase subunit alpha [Rhodospirillales bacterium]
MVWKEHDYEKIPGTYVFNGRRAVMGYALNKMCMTFNSEENRQEFLEDRDAYCRKFKLTDEQREAVLEKDILRLLQLGGNIYYLAKFGGIYGMNSQSWGAQQTGMTVEEFKAMLLKAGED